MELLNVSHLKKIYTTRFGGTQVQALSDVNFSVEEGEFVAIMGESGSGKNDASEHSGNTRQTDSRRSSAFRSGYG